MVARFRWFWLLLLPMTVWAADATLNWTNPTQREDGTAMAIGELKEIQIDYGPCNAAADSLASVTGTKPFAAPATTGVVTGLAYGKWCFRARAVDTANVASANSGTVWGQWLAPPKPPVLSVTVKFVYEVKSHPIDGPMLGRLVGEVPIGTACGMEPIVQTFGGTYYEVPLSEVSLNVNKVKSNVLVALCETVS